MANRQIVWPEGKVSEISEARLLPALAAALELRKAGHGDITIKDDTDGFERRVEWWDRIEPF
jgi:hypothetical protein